MFSPGFICGYGYLSPYVSVDTLSVVGGHLFLSVVMDTCLYVVSGYLSLSVVI